MLFPGKTLLPLTSSLSGWMCILQDTCQVNLVLLKDNKDGRTFFIIYTGVQKSVWNFRSGWKATVVMVPLNKISNKNFTYKHSVVVCAGWTTLMWTSVTSSKAAPWESSKNMVKKCLKKVKNIHHQHFGSQLLNKDLFTFLSQAAPKSFLARCFCLSLF